MKMSNSFTLIEILVVIVVIGVLSAFILVGMSSITSSASIAKSKAFFNSMDNALLLGRVSRWKLDESSGTAANDSWGTNTGTLKENGYAGACDATHCPQIQTTGCVSNNCLLFDGINDYVDCGTGVSIGTNSFTFSVWAKTSRNTTIQAAIQRVVAITGYELQIQVPRSSSSNTLFIITNSNYSNGFIYRYANPNNSNAKATDNKWHYYVGACDRSQHKYPDLYVDGVLNTVSGDGYGYCDQLIDNIPAGLFTIGGTASYFQGSIDEVAVYSSVVPTFKVQEQYYSGINKLFENNSIALEEFIQRLAELKSNLAGN